MKLDIPRMAEEPIVERGSGREKPAAPPARVAGMTVAVTHYFLAIVLQFGNYCFYLSGNGATADLALRQLFILPIAQAPVLLVATLLGLFTFLVQRLGRARTAVFIVALLCNACLVLDQRVFAVFFTSFTVELVDDSAWSWFTERVFAQLDPMVFVGLAGLIVATVATQQGIWGGPIASIMTALYERTTQWKSGKVHWRPGVGAALAVAGAAIVVQISTSADLRGLNRHPLVTLASEQIVSPGKLAPLNPQVNVFAPRYGSVLMGPDSLNGGASFNRMDDFGGAHPNLVIVNLDEGDADDGATRATWLDQTPLWNEAVLFDHVVPGRAAPNVLLDELLTSLSESGYATAAIGGALSQTAGDLSFVTDPCALATAPQAFHSWVQERRLANSPVAVHVKLDGRQAASCNTLGAIAELRTLTAVLLDAFQESGWAHQTIFALIVAPEARPLDENPATLQPIAMQRVALTVPGRHDALTSSSRPGSTDDIVATLYHLVGLKPAAGTNLLASDFVPRSLFWVQEGKLPQWGMRDGDWLYQASIVGTQQQLYNLAVDPGLSSNLALLLPRQAALYRSLCATWFAAQGHNKVSNKSLFVANNDGWWLPMDLAMPGAKRVDFGITGERPVPRQATLRRFHPYDPVIAQVSLRPFGEQRSMEFQWFGPAGRVDSFVFKVESVWNSVWVVPDRSFPMLPGRWTLLVSEQGTPRVAGDFLVDSQVPRAMPLATEPRALLEIAAGVYGPVIEDTGSPEFQPRERFTPDETPVVLTRWGPGPGVHQLTFKWRSPEGRIFVREQGLREEWQALRIELREPAQPWMPGDWEVTVYEGEVLVGTIVVRIDGSAP